MQHSVNSKIGILRQATGALGPVWLEQNSPEYRLGDLVQLDALPKPRTHWRQDEKAWLLDSIFFRHSHCSCLSIWNHAAGCFRLGKDVQSWQSRSDCGIGDRKLSRRKFIQYFSLLFVWRHDIKVFDYRHVLRCTSEFSDTGLPLLQPLRWRCVECAIHHERDVREE